MSKIPTIKELDEQHCKMCDSQMSTNIKQLFNEIMLSHMKIRNNYTSRSPSAFTKKTFAKSLISASARLY